MSSGWTLYKDGVIISASTDTSTVFNGFTIPKNEERCKKNNYHIVWEDESGHTTSGNFVINGCGEGHGEPYTYIVLVQKENEVEPCSGECSGVCSGDTVYISAYCETTSSVDTDGKFTIYDNEERAIHTQNANRHKYTFDENYYDEDKRYKIVFSNDCDESATTYYTVVAGEDCTPPPELVGIDLNLPSKTLWGEFNLGATNLKRRGSYYAWGDVEGYTINDADNFTLPSYKFYFSAETEEEEEELQSGYTKYNDKDELKVLESSDDASRYFKYGWSIPTKYHFEELFLNSHLDTFEWREHKDVFVLMGNSGGKMLIPTFTGYLEDGDEYESANTYFWTSQLSSGSVDNAIAYCISADTQYWYDIRIEAITSVDMPRYVGLQIRPIKEEFFRQQIKVERGAYTGDTYRINTITFKLDKEYQGSHEEVYMTFIYNANWNDTRKYTMGRIYLDNIGGFSWEIKEIMLTLDGGEEVNGTSTFTRFGSDDIMVISAKNL